MAILVTCPQCAARLNAPDIAAGKRVKCPKCQTLVDVPQLATAGFAVVDEPTSLPPPSPASKPRPAVQATDNDQSPRRSRKARPAKDADNNIMLIRNIVGGVLLVILLAVAGYIYYTKFFANREENGTADSNRSPDGNGAAPPPGGFVSLDDAKGKLIPLIPGGPVAGGVPKGGTNPAPKGGANPKAGTPPTQLTTPTGVVVSFPGSPSELPGLTKQLLQKQGLSGKILNWSDANGNACTLLTVQLPVGSSSEEAQKYRDTLVRQLSGQQDGFTLTESGAITHGGRTYDRIHTKSPDGQKTIELWSLSANSHLLIATIEYYNSDVSSPVRSFLHNLR